MTSIDPLEPLRKAAKLVSTADDVVTALVLRARLDDYSWADIGAVLGVSRQAAFQRYGRFLLDETDDVEA